MMDNNIGKNILGFFNWDWVMRLAIILVKWKVLGCFWGEGREDDDWLCLS